MNDEQVNPMARDRGEDGLEVTRILKADAHLYGEKPGAGRAHGLDDGVHVRGIAEQAAADIFLVNLGRGAAEIQVNTGDGMKQQLGDRAGDVGNLLADELREDGPAGAVLGNGADDVFFRAGLGVDAEKFGDEVVWRAMPCAEGHEREIGDILHRRKREHRRF